MWHDLHSYYIHFSPVQEVFLFLTAVRGQSGYLDFVVGSDTLVPVSGEMSVLVQR